MVKKCSKCGADRGLGEYHKDRSKKDGLISHCKSCKKVYMVAYYKANSERAKTYYKVNREKMLAYHKANPDRRSNWQYKYTYGITLGQKRQMVLDQKGVCAFPCGNTEAITEKSHLDHDHTTGVIRGVVHTKCNNRLIAALDHFIKTNTLEAALAYQARGKNEK